VDLTERVTENVRDVANIFISYRREDAAGHAGRLCDRLTARFGNARVFMDLQDIAPGQNFARSIDDTMAACKCVVVVIGPRWLESLHKRPQGAEDFVQHEIGAALRRDITIIPVLVGGARMPTAEQLPPALAALSYRNAVEVRDERFDDDVARLADAIGAHVGGDAGFSGLRHSTRARAVAAVLVMAGLIGAFVAWRTLRPVPGETTASETPALAATVPAATVPPVSPARAFDGDWIAEVQKEGQPPFRIRMTFVVTGDAITGQVRYPTGDGPVLEAKMVGNVLTFHTSHIPQFASAPAIIRYQAEAGTDEIRFTVTDDYGIGKGIARRRQATP
jgi:hypothetical protein